MSSPKKITFNPNAQSNLITGAAILAKAVASTLGPKGRNVIIEAPYGTPLITKDGATVAKHVVLPNPEQNLGAEILKQAAAKTLQTAGDSTTTSTVLAHAFLQEGSTLPHSPIEIKRAFDDLTTQTIGYLHSISTPVTQSNIKDIATISANNDTHIGELISKGYEHVGLDGIIAIEDSKTDFTHISTIDGVSIPSGFISPLFITNPMKQEVSYENPLILITDIKITRNEQIIPALDLALQNRRPLLIIADDIEAHALGLLIVNKVRANIPVVAIKAPAYAERRQAILQDLSALTSATLISHASNSLLENIKFSDFGSCAKITIDKDNTIIQEPTMDLQAVEVRKSIIKKQVEEETNEFVLEKLEQRLGFLSTKIALLHIGAPTKAELDELKARVDDALRATKSAIALGYVEGAGTALIKASEQIFHSDPSILQSYRNCLSSPHFTILSNAGVDTDVPLFNYNVLTSEYVDDLKTAGIIDPTLAIIEALKNATSAATMILLSDVTITNLNRDTYDPREGVEEFQTLSPE